MERYFARYPGVKAYMDATRQSARERGYVETVFGRRLYMPEINSSNNQRRMGAERAAINAPMQGTAADLIKLAMLAVHGWLQADKLQTRLILQVHDELVLEAPDGELEMVRARVPELMCAVASLAVPLVVDTGAGPKLGQGPLETCLGRLRGELQPMQARVQTVAGDELRVAAEFDDLAAVEHDDAIGALNGREPVRDHDRGAPLHQRIQSGLDVALRLGVERGGGFVEDQDGAFFNRVRAIAKR